VFPFGQKEEHCTISMKKLIPLGPGYQHMVGGRWESGGLAKQAMECSRTVVPTVEVEGELVKVGLEISRRKP